MLCVIQQLDILKYLKQTVYKLATSSDDCSTRTEELNSFAGIYCSVASLSSYIPPAMKLFGEIML